VAPEDGLRGFYAARLDRRLHRIVVVSLVLIALAAGSVVVGLTAAGGASTPITKPEAAAFARSTDRASAAGERFPRVTRNTLIDAVGQPEPRPIDLRGLGTRRLQQGGLGAP
jgi:hypothetical protein